MADTTLIPSSSLNVNRKPINPTFTGFYAANNEERPEDREKSPAYNEPEKQNSEGNSYSLIEIGPVYYRYQKGNSIIGLNLITLCEASNRTTDIVKGSIDVPNNILNDARSSTKGYEGAYCSDWSRSWDRTVWHDNGHFDAPFDSLAIPNVSGSHMNTRILSWLGIFPSISGRYVNTNELYSGINKTNHEYSYQYCWGGSNGYTYGFNGSITPTTKKSVISIPLFQLRHGEENKGVHFGLFIKSEYIKSVVKGNATFKVHESYFDHDSNGQTTSNLLEEHDYENSFNYGLRAQSFRTIGGFYYDLVQKPSLPVRLDFGVQYERIKYDRLENCTIKYDKDNYFFFAGLEIKYEPGFHLKDFIWVE